jgi:hypothetical protein
MPTTMVPSAKMQIEWLVEWLVRVSTGGDFGDDGSDLPPLSNFCRHLALLHNSPFIHQFFHHELRPFSPASLVISPTTPCGQNTRTSNRSPETCLLQST